MDGLYGLLCPIMYIIAITQTTNSLWTGILTLSLWMPWDVAAEALLLVKDTTHSNSQCFEPSIIMGRSLSAEVYGPPRCQGKSLPCPWRQCFWFTDILRLGNRNLLQPTLSFQDWMALAVVKDMTPAKEAHFKSQQWKKPGLDFSPAGATRITWRIEVIAGYPKILNHWWLGRLGLFLLFSTLSRYPGGNFTTYQLGCWEKRIGSVGTVEVTFFFQHRWTVTTLRL